MGLLYYSVTTLLLCGMCYCLTPDHKDGPCATIRCRRGFECKEQSVFCLRSPCRMTMGRCVRTAKPGKCPKSTGIGICIVTCMGDSDCPGDRKCCGNCPRTCKDPVLKQKSNSKPKQKSNSNLKPRPNSNSNSKPNPQSNSKPKQQSNSNSKPKPKPKVKPGKCPRTAVFGGCVAKCSSDAECPGKQKCCGSCPRECKAPITENVVFRCRSHWHCRGRLRCCGGRCVTRCGRWWPFFRIWGHGGDK